VVIFLISECVIEINIVGVGMSPTVVPWSVKSELFVDEKAK
jgi:hypothetical protein